MALTEMKQKTALVLGAGASCSYGFPVGKGLRQDILQIGESRDRTAELLGVGQHTLAKFVSAFKVAQTNSIDDFLGRRWIEFEGVGKAAIAHILLAAEARCNLFDETHNDHWYQYLVNELATDSWETFDPSWLSIVTFNYDRSLEFYLCSALQEIYAKTEAEVIERLRAVQIVHVYGTLGSPWRGDADFLEFKVSHLADAIEPAASRIKVIPEGRDDGPSIQQAQTLLSDASKICFLGFGFDHTNVRRLGAPKTFCKGKAPKALAATAMGMSRARVHRAAIQIFGAAYSDSLLARFQDTNCIKLLDETLILDRTG